VNHRRIAALLLTSALLGCVHLSGSVPPREAAKGTGHFLAGAARIDITPIPGIAMGGHSLIGRVGRGYWSRLHARAIYLEDATGHGIALVQCDLWSISGGLSDRVAQLLAVEDELLAKLGGRRLGREQIILAASHTHHSPALYSTDPFFSSLAATESGFDAQLFEFFAHRIAWAIADAVAAARPARVYEAQQAVQLAFRNRSMPAFRRNPEALEILQENADLPLCDAHPEYPDTEACRGVDPRVVALRVEAESGSLIAAMLFFAAHPTLISHLSTLYGADLSGAVAIQLERRMAATLAGEREPIVAVFNGAEGDVSGVWTNQSRTDVLRVAEAIIGDLWPKLSEPSAATWRRVDGPIAFQFERAALRGQRVEDPDLGAGRTAWIPMPGRASAAGAEDGRSGTAPFFFREGKRGVDLGAHGTKIGTLDLLTLFGVTIPPFWFTRLMTLTLPPPTRVGIGVYRLGPLRFAALPGEFTTVLGRRIARDITPPEGNRADVLLIGLAHNYAYYFTTPEEYDLQHYEGSSTIYGRWSGPYLRHRLTQLGQAAEHDCTEARPHEFRYRTGRRRHSDTRHIDLAPDRLDAGTLFVEDWAPGDAAAAPRARHCWRDAVPQLGTRSASRCGATRGGWECATPRVAIEVRTSQGWQPYARDGIPENDGGLTFLTLASGDERASAEATCWCSYWLAPEGADPSVAYRFSVDTLIGEVEVSEAFELDHSPPPNVSCGL
jgi:neutral ceramidase